MVKSKKKTSMRLAKNEKKGVGKSVIGSIQDQELEIKAQDRINLGISVGMPALGDTNILHFPLFEEWETEEYLIMDKEDVMDMIQEKFIKKKKLKELKPHNLSLNHTKLFYNILWWGYSGEVIDALTCLFPDKSWKFLKSRR